MERKLWKHRGPFEPVREGFLDEQMLTEERTRMRRHPSVVEHRGVCRKLWMKPKPSLRWKCCEISPREVAEG